MNVRRFNRNVWLIGTLALASIAVVVGLYFWNFPNGFSNDPQDWAAFGDYAGGVLGPLFAFLAFIAGLENLRVMRRQHRQDELIEAIRNLARDYERVSSMIVACEEPWVWGNDLDAAKGIKELPLRTLLESDSIDWEMHLGLLREGLGFRLQPNGELFQDRDIWLKARLVCDGIFEYLALLQRLGGAESIVGYYKRAYEIPHNRLRESEESVA